MIFGHCHYHFKDRCFHFFILWKEHLIPISSALHKVSNQLIEECKDLLSDPEKTRPFPIGLKRMEPAISVLFSASSGMLAKLGETDREKCSVFGICHHPEQIVYSLPRWLPLMSLDQSGRQSLVVGKNLGAGWRKEKIEDESCTFSIVPFYEAHPESKFFPMRSLSHLNLITHHKTQQRYFELNLNLRQSKLRA